MNPKRSDVLLFYVIWSLGMTFLRKLMSTESTQNCHASQAINTLSTVLCQVSGLCDILYSSYPSNCFTQIYRAQYGNAIFVSWRGHNNGGRKSMKTSGIHFCYNNCLDC